MVKAWEDLTVDERLSAERRYKILQEAIDELNSTGKGKKATRKTSKTTKEE